MRSKIKMNHNPFINIFNNTPRRQAVKINNRWDILIVIPLLQSKTTLIHKNISCFSFPFINRNIRIGRVKENRRWPRCTHTHTHTHTHTQRGDDAVFLWNLCLSASLSTFATLVQSHPRALNHLTFSLLFSTFTGLVESQFQGIESSQSIFDVTSLETLAQERRDIKKRRDIKQLSSGLRSSLLGLKSSQIYIIARTPTQIPVVTPPLYTLHVDTTLSSIPPTKLVRYFLYGTTCCQFTLGNRCTFNHATYVACQSDLQVNIQHSNLKDIFQKPSILTYCRPNNLRQMIGSNITLNNKGIHRKPTIKSNKFRQSCNTKNNLCYKHFKYTGIFISFTIKKFHKIYYESNNGSKNVIYLLECSRCQIQYVGKL